MNATSQRADRKRVSVRKAFVIERWYIHYIDSLAAMAQRREAEFGEKRDVGALPE